MVDEIEEDEEDGGLEKSEEDEEEGSMRVCIHEAEEEVGCKNIADKTMKGKGRD